MRYSVITLDYPTHCPLVSDVLELSTYPLYSDCLDACDRSWNHVPEVVREGLSATVVDCDIEGIRVVALRPLRLLGCSHHGL